MTALEVFSTEQVAKLVGLNPREGAWRIAKFSLSREYRIKPSVSLARGSGSRRLYDIENVYEIAIALRLLETGLRPAVIGDVIGQIRAKVKLRKTLRVAAESPGRFYLLIGRKPLVGKRLREKRFQILDFVVHDELVFEVENELTKRPKCDLLLVDVGPIFQKIRERRAEMRSAQDRGEL